MSYTDELLQDTPLTEQMMLQDVETMGLYCEDMQIPCKVVPATAQAPLPTLVAMLDSGEADRPWVLTHSFMPLDRETAEFTKYLQFYCELSGDLGEVEPSILLRGISRLNQALPFGAVLLVEPRPELGLPLMAAVRAVQGFPLDQPLDQGTFTEDLFLLETSCQIADFVLGALRTGKTVDEAFAQLSQ